MKRIKREEVVLICDVWAHIGEYIEIGKQLVTVLILSKDIKALVDSNYSWRRRCERDIPSDQIERVKSPEWNCNGSFKRIYEVTYKRRIQEGDNCFSWVFAQILNEKSRDSFISVGGFANCSHYSVKNTSTSRIRDVSLHIRDWFGYPTPSVEFVINSMTNEHEKRAELEEKREHIIFNTGLTRYSFFNGPVQEYHSGNIFFSFLSSIYYAVPNGKGSSSEKGMLYVYVTNGFILRENEEGVLKFLTPCFGLMEFIGRGRSGSTRLSKDENRRDVQLKMINQHNPFDLTHDILKNRFKTAKKKYEFICSYTIFPRGIVPEKKRKGRMCVKRHPCKFREGLEMVSYCGTYKEEGSKDNKALYVAIAHLCGYFSFGFVDPESLSCRFNLGGKVLDDGRITGFLYDPNCGNHDVHGIFSMIPCKK